MSETMIDAVEPPMLPALENLLVVPSTIQVNDRPVEQLTATFGTPRRTVVVRPLDLGEQFALAEVAGGNEGNQTWMTMATCSAAVVSVDDWPMIRGTWTKTSLRETLRRLNMDGLRAVMMALNGYRGPGEVVAPADPAGLDTVKN